MGQVYPMEKVARVITERHDTPLSDDLHSQKYVRRDIAAISSKKLRSKLGGLCTHLMKPIQRGPVRGISIKLQEEQKERRENYVSAVSALNQEIIEVDPDTKEMLKLQPADHSAYSWDEFQNTM